MCINESIYKKVIHILNDEGYRATYKVVYVGGKGVGVLQRLAGIKTDASSKTICHIIRRICDNPSEVYPMRQHLEKGGTVYY